MDIGQENASQLKEIINDSIIAPNLGNDIDKCLMERKAKKVTKQELEQELQWVKYRIEILDIIDSKLIQMKKIAVQASQDNLEKNVSKELNRKINELAIQVKELDENSKKIEIKLKLGRASKE